MKKALMGVMVTAGLAAMLGSNVAEAKEQKGWTIDKDHPGQALEDGKSYSGIFNHDQNYYLKIQDRAGANLGWSSAPTTVKFKKPGGGQIKCGDLFAIFVDKEWLIYESQTMGINLSTRTKDARVEWKFTACTAGQVIKTGEHVSLTNTKENDAIIGGTRAWGVNLLWANTALCNPTSFSVGPVGPGKCYHKDVIPSSARKRIQEEIDKRR